MLWVVMVKDIVNDIDIMTTVETEKELSEFLANYDKDKYVIGDINRVFVDKSVNNSELINKPKGLETGNKEDSKC